MNKIAWWLVVLGALNSGFTGIGNLMGGNWNIVNFLVGKVPSVEAVVYILVGTAAVLLLLEKKKAL